MSPASSVIPAQAGIQTGGSTAKTQRRKGKAWFKAPAAIDHKPVNNAAGVETRKSPLRLCAFAVEPAWPTDKPSVPGAPAYAGVTAK